jgi:hypothetical protein
MNRRLTLTTDDENLIKECSISFFKATGKGGQKRNKTSSAVRITHTPTSTVVTASEDRSQHKNRHIALKKLRLQLAFNCREDFTGKLTVPLNTSPNNNLFYILIAEILDCFYENNYSISATAELLGISSSKLLKIIYKEPLLLNFINQQRTALNLKHLKKN